jgi:hypothetical protein
VLAVGTVDVSFTFDSGEMLTPSGNADVLIAAFDRADGVVLTAGLFGDPNGSAMGTGISNAAGTAAIAGSFTGNLEIGGTMLVSEGANPDVFVAWFAQ